MMMSKALGPPVGPISALDSDSDLQCTNVFSAPSLFAKMALSPSGAFVVVIRKILTLLSVVENAPSNCASGRNANPVISSGEDPNSLALYTCLYLCEAKAGGPMSKGKMLLPLPSTLVFAPGDT